MHRQVLELCKLVVRSSHHTPCRPSRWEQVKQDDAIEVWLTRRLMTFLTQSSYAEAFGILRRKPIAGYDLSLVITASHCQIYGRQQLVDFITEFLDNIFSAYGLKMLVTSRGRAVATEYLQSFIV